MVREKKELDRERRGEGDWREKGRDGKGKGRFKGIAGGFLSHLDEDVECELHSLSQKLRMFFIFPSKCPRCYVII